jgi:DNA-binding XRE family transcriptional regulator
MGSAIILHQLDMEIPVKAPRNTKKIPASEETKALIGRPTKYDPDKMIPAVLEVGASGGSKAEMAVAIDVSRETLYQWMREKPDFSDAIKKAELLSQVWWEKLGKKGAYGEVNNFNATSFIFNMKNRFREDWRDVRQTEVTGEKGGPVQVEAIAIDSRALSAEQREAFRQALLAAKAAKEGDE